MTLHTSGSVPKKIIKIKSRSEVLLSFNVRDHVPHFWMKVGRHWFSWQRAAQQLGVKNHLGAWALFMLWAHNREARLAGSALNYLESGLRMLKKLGNEWKLGFCPSSSVVSDLLPYLQEGTWLIAIFKSLSLDLKGSDQGLLQGQVMKGGIWVNSEQWFTACSNAPQPQCPGSVVSTFKGLHLPNLLGDFQATVKILYY